MGFQYFELWDIRTWRELPSVNVLYKGKIPLALAKSPENALGTLSGFANEHGIPVKGHLEALPLEGKPVVGKHLRVYASR